MSFTNIFHVALIFFLLFLSQKISAQSEYNMYVMNTSWTDDKTIEFDINIKGINQEFELTSYQCSFLLIQNIVDRGNLSFAYIDGTSQLSNQPNFGTGINDLDGHLELTFASLAGSDNISTTPILVGRFILQSTESLPPGDIKIQWDFEGFVSTILTGAYFQNITIPAFHDNNTMLDLKTENVEIPDQYKLFQNYPNPFNPTTKITFSLPKESNINLTVFNLLGQEIEVLANDRVDAGTHSVDFVGEGLPSGMYFCKLRVENKFLETIKMILLR